MSRSPTGWPVVRPRSQAQAFRRAVPDRCHLPRRAGRGIALCHVHGAHHIRARRVRLAPLGGSSGAGRPIRRLGDNPAVVTAVSSTGFSETLTRVLVAIARRNLTVFAQFDQAAAARTAGMELADERVVVFGNPRAGTPLMQEDPRIGIELPLRLLVWDGGDAVMVGYNDPQDLAASYEVSAHAPTLAAMSSLLADLTREAAE
jgi:uncharacterized protein (DUF302 family)